ncbi:MAG: S46 family peptidase [Candidatus Latescibacterota bacterium]
MSRPLLLCALLLAGGTALGDEGMWLYSAPPRALLAERYGFSPSDAWLEHLRLASVRFNSGGSGSFVSGNGLVLTNHHVGADALQKLSDAQHDYLRDGFYARTPAQEMRCHDLELNVLVATEDVTAQVNAAVVPGMDSEEAFLARRAAIARLEEQSFRRTGLRSDVVTLYQGGQYHLYRSKRYTDVRLVFAPEQQIAFFGGDPDNFEYPRFDLDLCLLRVYEEGRPVHTPHHLHWSPAGAGEGELVFVSGHPAETGRLLTAAELATLRDVHLPYRLGRLKGLESLLVSWSGRSAENARRARDEVFGVQNWRKGLDGQLAGMLEPDFMPRKRETEEALRRAAAADSALAGAAGAWERIDRAEQILAQQTVRYDLLEAGAAFDCELFHIARTLLRAADELPKPNDQRLPEFGEAALPSLELELFSDKPIFPDFEQVKLAGALTFLVGQLGFDSELVQGVLAGRSPRARAAELVQHTRVGDVEVRRRLYEGGRPAVEAAADPMVALARRVDPEARAVRRIVETQEEAKRQAHAQIGAVRFAVGGTDAYPDATFTLRLALGVVKGYKENGTAVPFQTTYAGLYRRAAEQGYAPPFDLPERWRRRQGRIDPDTPLDFVCTADIVGGNSGSPVVNRHGELVGLIFDGNLQSLVLDVQYTEEQARAVAVHSAAIVHALDAVYDAGPLVAELLGR